MSPSNDSAIEDTSQLGLPDAADKEVGPAAPKVSPPNVSGDDVDELAIMNALRGVIDPELGDNVVDLGMVKRLERSAHHGGLPAPGSAHA